jgi:hypothetical protein
MTRDAPASFAPFADQDRRHRCFEIGLWIVCDEPAFELVVGNLWRHDCERVPVRHVGMSIATCCSARAWAHGTRNTTTTWRG